MRSICAIEGVEAAGVRDGKFGLTLIRAEGTAAGVFTSNLARAAPIELMMDRVRRGRLGGVIANSGCANAHTGVRGLEDAAAMAAIGGSALGVDEREVAVASTGVIGRYLDLPLIGRQASRLSGELARTSEAESAAARAIMTTDLVEKHALVEADGFSVAGICKGSGMIAPNMGTFLAFLYTDAGVEQPLLAAALRLAADRSFNRVVVDGDTSTNDVAFLTATGAAGRVDPNRFEKALEACCRALAIQTAADGEGATKLLEVTVTGAPEEEDAATVARTVVGSPLVKTAVYGEDPNWGRVIAAAGRAGVEFDPYEASLWIGEGTDAVPVVRRGEIVVELPRAKAAMAGKRVVVLLDLANGEGEATAWGCDLTEGYVEINGKYTT